MEFSNGIIFPFCTDACSILIIELNIQSFKSPVYTCESHRGIMSGPISKTSSFISSPVGKTESVSIVKFTNKTGKSQAKFLVICEDPEVNITIPGSFDEI